MISANGDSVVLLRLVLGAWRVTDLSVASGVEQLVATVTLQTQLVPVLPQ